MMSLLKNRSFLALHGLFFLMSVVAICLWGLLDHFSRTNITLAQAGAMNDIPSTMAWNVFLALVAYDAARLFTATTSKTLKVLSALVFIAFYPNTFYMLTDAVHFADWLSRDGKLDIIHTGAHTTIYFVWLGLGIFFGLLLGVFAAYHLLAAHWRLHPVVVGLASFVLIFLSSVAIYAGRDIALRLNSWNLVTRPFDTLGKLFAIISIRNLPFLISFTLLQLFAIALLATLLPRKDTYEN
ncbi:MAG: DUF1361 domain-containing protein [Streptococcaceae bacterium]|jgi:uncharacterized membrane protein|nr:DUF1361 domain-containing protein [Streptococcaceae bacterium]